MGVLPLILAATIANSLVALVGAVTLGWSAKTLDRILHILVGFSAVYPFVRLAEYRDDDMMQETLFGLGHTVRRCQTLI